MRMKSLLQAKRDQFMFAKLRYMLKKKNVSHMRKIDREGLFLDTE